ncbi:hypothetical protein [Streptomyces sp. T028]|uniref:hypothetical protein n=1 Tax=Streptomyces sp. T028 TaxID=3394379 RepID=UPI003A88FF20
MTADDMHTVAVLGGWSFLFTALAVLSLIVGVLATFYRLALTVRARHRRRRAARQAVADLATCRAIDALGTTTNPTEK